MRLSADAIKAQAMHLGFNFTGIIPAAPAPTLAAYQAWIEAGMHGSMGYLARPDRQARRADLCVIMPGAQSLILVGMDYRVNAVPSDILNDPSRGRIASYAWRLDYHEVMSTRLEALAGWMQSQMPLTHRVYVDTGAILERAHAQQAGMGFIGKNTMLIHPRRGSYFFLGEILVDWSFDHYDTPGRATMCGSCTRCLTACPTDAFPRPHVLDARKCISYLTIEHKGFIDHELRPLIGNWIYGCDVCQDVCPWNRFMLESAEPAFQPRSLDTVAPPILEALTLDESTFNQIYAGSPIQRIKRERWVRNACIVAGNWSDPSAIPALTALLSDESPLVRGHAVWALGQLGAESVLHAHKPHETHDDVLAEYAAAL